MKYKISELHWVPNGIRENLKRLHRLIPSILRTPQIQKSIIIHPIIRTWMIFFKSTFRPLTNGKAQRIWNTKLGFRS